MLMLMMIMLRMLMIMLINVDDVYGDEVDDYDVAVKEIE